MDLFYISAIFAALQLINVMLNTAKTLIMARTDNPHLSALINAITYGFYTAVVKQIASLDLSITIIIVVITNVIGVYLTYWITSYIRKDNLWKIELYLPNEPARTAIKRELEKNNIAFNLVAPNLLVVYCYTQDESTVVHKAIENAGSDAKIKYNITEITKHF